MNPVHVLYGIILVGSLTFGLEAILLAFGGRISTIFQREKIKLLTFASIIGLIIAGVSIGLVIILELELIYLPVFLIGFTFTLGKLVGTWSDELFKQKEAPPAPKTSSEKEIRIMLEKRGFEELVKEEEEE